MPIRPRRSTTSPGMSSGNGPGSLGRAGSSRTCTNESSRSREVRKARGSMWAMVAVPSAGATASDAGDVAPRLAQLTVRRDEAVAHERNDQVPVAREDHEAEQDVDDRDADPLGRDERFRHEGPDE